LLFALLALMTTGALFAAKRDWKAGTVEATVLKDEDYGAMGMGIPAGYGQSSVMVTRMRIVWQGYRIEGNGYVFKVACPLRRNRPNVTVHGPVKYAMEPGGKFYMQDEDGREFKMFVVEKALAQLPAQRPAESVPPKD
jgi:hypothetical protein